MCAYWTLTTGSPAAAMEAWLPNFLHLQNYLGSPRLHTWSLAVEEHFYLALPFVLWLTTLRQVRRGGPLESIPAIPIIACGLIVLCIGLRYFACRNYNGAASTMYYPTHLRMDSLFFGVMLAYLEHFNPQWVRFVSRHRSRLLVLGLVLVSPMLFMEPYAKRVLVLGCTLLYLGYGSILLAMVHTPHGSGWLGKSFQSVPARALAFIGVLSFPIYLWHVDIGWTQAQWLVRHEFLSGLATEVRWCAVFALYLSIATAGGMFWAFVVEKPSLALRERLFPRRNDALTPALEPHGATIGADASEPRQEDDHVKRASMMPPRAVPVKTMPIPSGDNQ